MKMQGFLHLDDLSLQEYRILFIEAKGKDASFDRYRVCLYYTPNLACTHFFLSEKEYNEYLAEKTLFVYTDFDEFKEHWNIKEKFCFANIEFS